MHFFHLILLPLFLNFFGLFTFLLEMEHNKPKRKAWKQTSSCTSQWNYNSIWRLHCKFFLLYANPQILDLIVCNAHFEHNKLQMAGVYSCYSILTALSTISYGLSSRRILSNVWLFTTYYVLIPKILLNLFQTEITTM